MKKDLSGLGGLAHRFHRLHRGHTDGNTSPSQTDIYKRFFQNPTPDTFTGGCWLMATNPRLIINESSGFADGFDADWDGFNADRDGVDACREGVDADRDGFHNPPVEHTLRPGRIPGRSVGRWGKRGKERETWEAWKEGGERNVGRGGRGESGNQLAVTARRREAVEVFSPELSSETVAR